MDYILFGIQGSGKGTQGKRLAAQNGYAYFELGGELRKLAKEQTELAQKVKRIMEAGQLVSNEIVMEIVESFMNSLPKDQSVVFDGIPRTDSQRELFEELMRKHNKKPVGIFINVPDEEAKRRLLNRWMSRSTGNIYTSKEEGLKECDENDLYQRADDNEESIKVRIEAFKTETMPLIDWYKSQNRLLDIDGTLPIDRVTENIKKTLFLNE